MRTPFTDNVGWLAGWLLAGNIHPLAGSIRIYSIEFLDKQSPMNCGVGGVDGGVS